MAAGSPLDRFLERFSGSVRDGTFIRAALSGPVDPKTDAEKILLRLITLRGQPSLSLTLRFARRDETRNLSLEESELWLRDQLVTRYRNAQLGTTQRDWQLIGSGTPKCRLVGHAAAQSDAPDRAHDRTKPGILDARAHDWLAGLAVVDAAGKPRLSMSDKLRQIDRYLEILSHLVKDAAWPAGQALRIADMGSGKGYLTFGIWHWLHRVEGRSVRVSGVESRPELVRNSNTLAHSIGATGLEFREGSIADIPVDDLDILVALHACNTATDEAILRGISAGARLIVVAPCCHQDLRPRLVADPEPLGPILRHGLFKERFAEWLTDGLRSLYLEGAGYQVKAIEFVSSEHTGKNLMLAAVRSGETGFRPQIRAQIGELKRFFGLGEHPLDGLLGGGGGSEAAKTSNRSE